MSFYILQIFIKIKYKIFVHLCYSCIQVIGGIVERLPEFEEVISETNSDHRNILLGNGFSIACDNSFDYGTLFLFSHLPHEIKNIFNELNMIRQRNFCTNAIRKIDIIITIELII